MWRIFIFMLSCFHFFVTAAVAQKGNLQMGDYG